MAKIANFSHLVSFFHFYVHLNFLLPPLPPSNSDPGAAKGHSLKVILTVVLLAKIALSALAVGLNAHLTQV